MLGLPDSYTIKARLYPALIAALPGLALAAVTVSWQQLGISHAIGGGAALLLFYVFSDMAQQHGKRLESGIFKKMGGKPSTVMLRHRDPRFGAVAKRTWCKYIGCHINQEAPTDVDELADPASADVFYTQCGDWLREQMRDYKQFHLLFDNLVRYGFRRNLLGLKKPALVLNSIIVLGCCIALWFRLPISADDYASMRLIYVLIACALHAAYFLLVVQEKAVMQAADEYARQLLLGCDAVIGGSPAASAAKSKGNKRFKKIEATS